MHWNVFLVQSVVDDDDGVDCASCFEPVPPKRLLLIVQYSCPE